MKIRLDDFVLQQGLATTIESARAMIRAGEIYVDDQIHDKPGQLVSSHFPIRAKEKCPFVSRGGYKLEKGLKDFQVNATDLVCIDVGASTGGFTDCLLQHGARKVFAVDVAYGQLSWKIRQDSRVVVKERLNARKICLDDLDGSYVDLAVMDASFISITKILPALSLLFEKSINIITLIKPQFELPREDIGPGGVVTQVELHQKSIALIENFVKQSGWKSRGVTESPIKGPKGNKEFLMHISS